MPDTSKKVTQIDEEWRSWAMQQPTIGGCLFCPDFKPKGTGVEVKQASADHLATVHPELVGKRRSKRRRSNPAVIAFRQSLTEEESEAVDEERRRRLKLLGIDPVEPTRSVA
jgi:hypothetical protein